MTVARSSQLDFLERVPPALEDLVARTVDAHPVLERAVLVAFAREVVEVAVAHYTEPDPERGIDRCRYCGAPCVWGVNSTNQKRVPLDTRPPIYRVTLMPGRDPVADLQADQYRGRGEAMEGVRWMVNHFATCPKWQQARQGPGAHPSTSR